MSCIWKIRWVVHPSSKTLQYFRGLKAGAAAPCNRSGWDSNQSWGGLGLRKHQFKKHFSSHLDQTTNKKDAKEDSVIFSDRPQRIHAFCGQKRYNSNPFKRCRWFSARVGQLCPRGASLAQVEHGPPYIWLVKSCHIQTWRTNHQVLQAWLMRTSR